MPSNLNTRAMAVVWECLSCKKMGHEFFYEDITWLNLMDIVETAHSEQTGCKAPRNKLVMNFTTSDKLAFTRNGVIAHVGT